MLNVPHSIIQIHITHSYAGQTILGRIFFIFILNVRTFRKTMSVAQNIVMDITSVKPSVDQSYLPDRSVLSLWYYALVSPPPPGVAVIPYVIEAWWTFPLWSQARKISAVDCDSRDLKAPMLPQLQVSLLWHSLKISMLDETATSIHS